MSKPMPKEERRRQLLDAALSCFGARGYHLIGNIERVIFGIAHPELRPELASLLA